MLPECRSGKISVLALPLDRTLRAPWILQSPVRGPYRPAVRHRRQGPVRAPRTVATASRIRSSEGCSALPFVENERKATRASVSRNVRVFPAASRAMSASCVTVGIGTTAQSANTRVMSGRTIRKKLDTTDDPCAQTNAVNSGTYRIGRRRCRSTDETVGISCANHSRSEVHGVVKPGDRFDFRDASSFPLRQQQGGVPCLSICGRLNDLDPRKLHASQFRCAGNDSGHTNENRPGHRFRSQSLRQHGGRGGRLLPDRQSFWVSWPPALAGGTEGRCAWPLFYGMNIRRTVTFLFDLDAVPLDLLVERRERNMKVICRFRLTPPHRSSISMMTRFSIASMISNSELSFGNENDERPANRADGESTASGNKICR